MIRRKMTGLKAIQSIHDFKHTVLGSGHMGKILPVFCRRLPPRSKLKDVRFAIETTFEPMIRPLKHTVMVDFHVWVVRIKNIWNDPTSLTDKFERFITDVDGKLGLTPPYLSGPVCDNRTSTTDPKQRVFLAGTLTDYFGYPIDVVGQGDNSIFHIDSLRASALPHLAYLEVFDKFYRHQKYDESIIVPKVFGDWQVHVDFSGGAKKITSQVMDEHPIENLPLNEVRRRCWPATDYFMRVLPSPQLGDAVVIPQADGSSIPTIRDLTLAYQVQGLKEDQNEDGTDLYRDHLLSNFGVAPINETLRLPEYIGGSRAYMCSSELFQTSESTDDSPQGNRSGIGRAMVMSSPINYETDEDCIVLGVISVIPEATYSNGLDKQWNILDTLDFVFPQTNFLGDDAVKTQEITAKVPNAVKQNPIGFVPRNEWLRFVRSYYCGEMRPEAPVNQSYWHLGRYFGNSTSFIYDKNFVYCNPDEARIFAVPERDTFIYHVFGMGEISLPIPRHAQRGLSDHR